MNKKKSLLRLDELVDNVNELIRLGKGDLGRLTHIKDTLQQNKILYESDREYLEKLSEQYLNDKPNVDETHYDQPNSNLFCYKCSQNLKSDNSFCPKCGTPQEKQHVESFCKKCGNKVYGNNPCINCNQSTTSSTKSKKKGRSKKKKIGIAFGIIILLFFGLAILSSGNDETGENKLNDVSRNKTVNWQDTTSEVQQKILDKTEYSWEELSYDELMRHNEKYVGKTVNLRGQVMQVQNVYRDEYVALVYTKCENFYGFFCNDDIVWINYSDVKILDEDIISFWGDVKGLKNYKSIMGAPMTVPEIDVIAIDISIKKGEK